MCKEWDLVLKVNLEEYARSVFLCSGIRSLVLVSRINNSSSAGTEVTTLSNQSAVLRRLQLSWEVLQRGEVTPAQISFLVYLYQREFVHIGTRCRAGNCIQLNQRNVRRWYLSPWLKGGHDLLLVFTNLKNTDININTWRSFKQDLDEGFIRRQHDVEEVVRILGHGRGGAR